MKTLLLIGLLSCGAAATSIPVHAFLELVTPRGVRINEVLADNCGAIVDEHGEYEDYIELYNPTDRPVDVGGMSLSDDGDDPTRWRLPQGTLVPARGYLLLWADGEPHEGPRHGPFALSRRGEELCLYDTPERGLRLLDRVAFGALPRGLAVGLRRDGEGQREILAPTPGRANGDS